MIFKKEHVELKDITKNEKDEIKELFTNAEQRLNNLKTQEDIESVCNYINGYEFMTNTYNDDLFTISIATDNKKPYSLQGIRVYIDKTYKPLRVSNFIDIYFNDEEYPFECCDIKTELV